MAEGTLPDTYIYDYEARLKRNKGLQKTRNSVIDTNKRLGITEAEMLRRLVKFKKDTPALLKDQYRADPFKDMQELPKCPKCGKILFINGECANGCRF